jgi:hypothetical protein
MPKLERWIVASKMIPVFDQETLHSIVALGATIGGGWSQVHQHVNVNVDNKEKIEELLRSRGYQVSDVSDQQVQHPEMNCMSHMRHHQAGGE